MQNNWPLIAAAIMISVAVALGLWKRDAIVESAAHRLVAPVAAAPDAATPAKPLPAEQPAQSEAPKAPAPLPLPKDLPPRPAVAAPVQPQQAPPAQVAVQPAQPAQPAQQQLAQAAPLPAAQPAAPPQPKFSVPSSQPPAVVQPPKPVVAAPKPAAPADALGSLRAKLEAQLTMQAADLAAGGYAFQLDGARIEVQGLPNWGVTIWNINPVKEQAEVETDNFKRLYQIVAAELGFDPNQKGVALGNGSTSLQTTSKLGNLTVVQDPAKGNSATIQPNQRRIPLAPVAPAQPAQVAPAQPVQAAPAQPAPAPAPQPAAENKAAPAPAQPQPAVENRAAPAPAPAQPQPAPQNWVNNPAPKN